MASMRKRGFSSFRPLVFGASVACGITAFGFARNLIATDAHYRELWLQVPAFVRPGSTAPLFVAAVAYDAHQQAQAARDVGVSAEFGSGKTISVPLSIPEERHFSGQISIPSDAAGTIKLRARAGANGEAEVIHSIAVSSVVAENRAGRVGHDVALKPNKFFYSSGEAIEFLPRTISGEVSNWWSSTFVSIDEFYGSTWTRASRFPGGAQQSSGMKLPYPIEGEGEHCFQLRTTALPGYTEFIEAVCCVWVDGPTMSRPDVTTLTAHADLAPFALPRVVVGDNARALKHTWDVINALYAATLLLVLIAFAQGWALVVARDKTRLSEGLVTAEQLEARNRTIRRLLSGTAAIFVVGALLLGCAIWAFISLFASGFRDL